MLLKTEGLSKSFMRGNNAFPALNNVNFSINEGDYINIIGRSGSGKTTFLNLIAGILKPSAGNVLFNGKDLASFDDREMSVYRNEQIGFVPQNLGALPNLTVSENVRVPHFLFKRDGDGSDRAMVLLEMLGIAHLKDELPRNLSGGETKRMLIARALMNSPKLFIADEPTADLDRAVTKEVMDIITKINQQGAAVLIVTHDMDILTDDSDVYTMSDGALTRGRTP
ncbi:ABC transporter ATP-binding protein [Treponema phagedenis]|uniref:ABC transporter ATP-binding protein n=1 Tax=Treponema phagedenis TaxID=162 RepID=A0AAE6M7I2_TREPH|nr:ABC transporter ATP-binding protein [Treponema phagedenis]QEJ97860.1 ABC transporter ATP-binding protein [Treponema phagedenis]QEK05783.1 ABC transporter ATP-binding protein [Treponema phagedenis]TYT79664.1 ABC transporter ATP-binding protein [Treponema phagedenis]